MVRAKQHYLDLLARNPNATIGFALAAQAVYAARHGSFDGPNESDGTNMDEFRAIARSLKQKYGENLTREQVEAEMQAPETTEIRIRAVPVPVHTALKHLATDARVSLNTYLVQLLTDAVKKEVKKMSRYIGSVESMRNGTAYMVAHEYKPGQYAVTERTWNRYVDRCRAAGETPVNPEDVNLTITQD